MNATGLPPPAFNGCSFLVQVDCGDLPTTAPFAKISGRSGSFDGSACNARQIQLTAYDTGASLVPIRSIGVDSERNIAVDIPPIVIGGVDTLSFSAHVLDSMQDGFAAIHLLDTNGIIGLDTLTYCAIADTNAPQIAGTWNGDTLTVEVREAKPWDRGLKIVTVDASNFTIDTLPTTANTQGKLLVTFHAVNGGGGRLHVHAIDLAGNASDYTWNTDAVSNPITASMLRVYPNPSAEGFTLELPQFNTHVQVFDLLGRCVARFDAQGTYQWDPNGLAGGTYLLRTSDGSEQRIVKQ
jgi:hypothetical protein